MKKEYVYPKIEQILLDDPFIRTSFGNDDNDGYWEDENTKPKGGA